MRQCSPDEEGIQLEGLIPKKKYKFRVKAVNDEGESDPLEIDEPIMSSTDESGKYFRLNATPMA